VPDFTRRHYVLAERHQLFQKPMPSYKKATKKMRVQGVAWAFEKVQLSKRYGKLVSNLSHCISLKCLTFSKPNFNYFTSLHLRAVTKH
jgi:hypothetical protein